MGNTPVKVQDEPESLLSKISDRKSLTSSDGRKLALQNEVYVHHYMPSTFPLHPVLTEEHLVYCRRSWKLLIEQRGTGNNGKGTMMQGLTDFCAEFYERLGKVDEMGQFNSILMKHAVGANKVAAKGAILMRIMDFLLKFEGDTPDVRIKLRMLGLSHNHKMIRPWQYAVFLEVFLQTLSCRLGANATPAVMTAWVNLFAFSLLHMLPTAIDGLVDEREAFFNFNKKDGEKGSVSRGLGDKTASESTLGSEATQPVNVHMPASSLIASPSAATIEAAGNSLVADKGGECPFKGVCPV
eukprot:gene28068-33893_t